MKEINGDILDIEYGIIGHQVNCQLTMDIGLAKKVREKFPRVYTEITEVMGAGPVKKRLGMCQMVEIKMATLYVANLFGQLHQLPLNILHTDYVALGLALRNLNRWRNKMAGSEFPIYLPKGLGCAEAGGNWGIIYGIIRDAIPNAILVKK